MKNIERLKDYLSHKTWLWWRIFGNFYRVRCALEIPQWQFCKANFNAKDLLLLCRTKDDLKQVLKIAKEVDREEKIFGKILADLRFCRPISWQYDFVKIISDSVGIDLLQTLEIDSLTDAYCMAELHDLDVKKLTADLDNKYSIIFNGAIHKTNLLRRNFSLLLEVTAPKNFESSNAGLCFREIAERYVSRVGVKGLINALKKAQTPETKLSADENEVLALAYYSPYHSDEHDGIAPQVPGWAISTCVANRLASESAYLESLRTISGHLSAGNDEEDDDKNDEIKAILAQTHSPVYFDPTERCLIDVQRTSPLYAHVYIEKFPQDNFNNSLPDFIQYKKGCLYTVEFVENLKTLEIAEQLNEKLNAIKREINRLEKTCFENPSLVLNSDFRNRYAYFSRLFNGCFCISEG